MAWKTICRTAWTALRNSRLPIMRFCWWTIVQRITAAGICDAYSEKDSRFRVIHKTQNGGPSRARQEGLSAASGEWIWFMDSDDWLAPEALRVLSEEFRDDLDMLVFGMILCHENLEGKTVWEETVLPDAAQGGGSKRGWKFARRLRQPSEFSVFVE